MPVRDFSAPVQSCYVRPSFNRASLEKPASERSRISNRRMLRMQIQTDLYLRLDPDPQHRLAHCSTVYELEDRTKPSISSF